VAAAETLGGHRILRRLPSPRIRRFLSLLILSFALFELLRIRG